MLYSMKVAHLAVAHRAAPELPELPETQDIESILGTILQENGVTEWSPLFSEPHPSREFCVQYGDKTDYAFPSWAVQEGIFFYEEHVEKKTDQSLVLRQTVRYWPSPFPDPLESEHPYRGDLLASASFAIQRTNPPFFRGDQRLHL